MRPRLTVTVLLLGLALLGAAPSQRAAEDAMLARGRSVSNAYLTKGNPILPGLAYSCLAGAALFDSGDREGASVVRASADILMRKLLKKNGEPAGWGYEGAETCGGPGASDSFGDGSCNAGDTVYGFQTGLAATCLARASLVTGERRYALAAQQVLRRWGRAAAAPCDGCVQFQPSDSANDHGRYIRNVNTLLGMAAAWTWTATNDPGMRRLARGVTRTEAREAAANNLGYFSIFDPKYKADSKRESARLENHYPFVAKGLQDIGALTGDPQATALARRAMADFLACRGLDCSKFPCSRWAGGQACWATPQALTPCLFRNDPQFAGACDRVLAHQPKFGGYQTWIVADGRSPRFRASRR